MAIPKEELEDSSLNAIISSTIATSLELLEVFVTDTEDEVLVTDSELLLLVLVTDSLELLELVLVTDSLELEDEVLVIETLELVLVTETEEEV